MRKEYRYIFDPPLCVILSWREEGGWRMQSSFQQNEDFVALYLMIVISLAISSITDFRRLVFFTVAFVFFTLLFFFHFRSEKKREVRMRKFSQDDPEKYLQIRVLERLLAQGPTCANELAVEFCFPSNEILEALHALEKNGLTSKRVPRWVKYEPEEVGEERWSAF